LRKSFWIPVAFIGSIIADERIGHGYNLLVVRRVGQDFLVAAHGRIEDDLSALAAFGAKRGARKHGSVFQ